MRAAHQDVLEEICCCLPLEYPVPPTSTETVDLDLPPRQIGGFRKGAECPGPELGKPPACSIAKFRSKACLLRWQASPSRRRNESSRVCGFTVDEVSIHSQLFSPTRSLRCCPCFSLFFMWIERFGSFSSSSFSPEFLAATECDGDETAAFLHLSLEGSSFCEAMFGITTRGAGLSLCVRTYGSFLRN